VKRYLLDTGIMGDFINRRRGVAGHVDEARTRGDRVGTCWPVIGELWFGVERSVTRELNRERLIRGLARVPTWPFEDEAAQHFGRLCHELRRTGRAMSIVDMQLAAIAFALGNCTVVSKDGDLSAVPGLHVENWATG
jgi:tRNA(fMet)-specific endonuclease VapC